MLPKKHRLKRREFPVSGGRRAAFAYGSLRIFKDMPPKAAVVVSKKVFKTSVLRHKAKRRSLSALSPLLSTHSGGAVVMYPTVGVLKASFAELRASLRAALK